MIANMHTELFVRNETSVKEGNQGLGFVEERSIHTAKCISDGHVQWLGVWAMLRQQCSLTQCVSAILWQRLVVIGLTYTATPN